MELSGMDKAVACKMACNQNEIEKLWSFKRYIFWASGALE